MNSDMQWITRYYGRRYDFSNIELEESNAQYRMAQLFYPLSWLIVATILLGIFSGKPGLMSALFMWGPVVTAFYVIPFLALLPRKVLEIIPLDMFAGTTGILIKAIELLSSALSYGALFFGIMPCLNWVVMDTSVGKTRFTLSLLLVLGSFAYFFFIRFIIGRLRAKTRFFKDARRFNQQFSEFEDTALRVVPSRKRYAGVYEFESWKERGGLEGNAILHLLVPQNGGTHSRKIEAGEVLAAGDHIALSESRQVLSRLTDEAQEWMNKWQGREPMESRFSDLAEKLGTFPATLPGIRHLIDYADKPVEELNYGRR